MGTNVTVEDFASQSEWLCSSAFGTYRLVKTPDNTWIAQVPTSPDTWEADSEYDTLEAAIADLDLSPLY